MCIIFSFLHVQDHFYNLDRARHLKHPVFVIEVWDDDAFSRDDFIGMQKLVPVIYSYVLYVHVHNYCVTEYLHHHAIG